jgi:hypothetical protein
MARSLGALLSKRIFQAYRKIKHRLAHRMVYPVRHKIAMAFKLKILVGLGVGQ